MDTEFSHSTENTANNSMKGQQKTNKQTKTNKKQNTTTHPLHLHPMW